MFIHEKNGLFSIYGFGNVAVRKQDLDQIGGWETNNYDWGNEDVDLVQRFTNPASDCYIFRTVEPGLRHHYHQKMCHNADINLLGSQADMVNYLFENKIENVFVSSKSINLNVLLKNKHSDLFQSKEKKT
jgi:hypothetical protein